MGREMRNATEHIDKSLKSLKDWDAKDLVGRADQIGGELSQKMTTSKIRTFLDEVNRIDAEIKGKEEDFDSSRVTMLKPQLAYAAGREKGDERRVLTEFAELFFAAIGKVEDAKDFKRFMDFTQAVVAYHRFHGGSNR